MQFNLHSSIDHLVVSCYFIEDGLNYVYEKLGVKPVLGGTHLKMGTHNQLLKLGESVYLEVIAINHDAIDPTRPRWFGMDNFKPGTKPKLVTWVVKTNNIQYASEKSKLQHGKIESMQRGNYNWQITIPANGEMPMEGIAPTIIQWDSMLHPVQTLPDTNLSLERIEGYHFKADEINDSLAEIGFKGEFIAKTIDRSETPYLTAFIKTPGGVVEI